MEKQTGRIIKLLGGFYYIDTGDGKLVECRARGVFRKENVSPCVGDIASVEMTAGGKGYIMGIAPRKNELLRPPLANLDQLVFVCSAADPAPNLFVLDSMIAICEKKRDIPLYCFYKKRPGGFGTVCQNIPSGRIPGCGSMRRYRRRDRAGRRRPCRENIGFHRKFRGRKIHAA